MSKIKRLLDNYRGHIELPWQQGKSAQQRVIFCVYPESSELRFRANVEEFELATKSTGHGWAHWDMTDLFCSWLSGQKYKRRYFQAPQNLANLTQKLPDYLKEEFASFCAEAKIESNDVVAISGIGTLFGFVKVNEVIELIAPLVPGRLVVFFPGSYENNNYRLLDGYDGWGYLAIPITSEQ